MVSVDARPLTLPELRPIDVHTQLESERADKEKDGDGDGDGGIRAITVFPKVTHGLGSQHGSRTFLSSPSFQKPFFLDAGERWEVVCNVSPCAGAPFNGLSGGSFWTDSGSAVYSGEEENSLQASGKPIEMKVAIHAIKVAIIACLPPPCRLGLFVSTFPTACPPRPTALCTRKATGENWQAEAEAGGGGGPAWRRDSSHTCSSGYYDDLQTMSKEGLQLFFEILFSALSQISMKV